MGLGEFAALGAACMWAFSSILWGRIHLTALEMNLFKNLLGSCLLLTHLAITAAFAGTPIFGADQGAWGWLALSGLIGIVLGDTVYFRSIQILGPRRALVVATTAPIFGAILGWIFLRESVAIVQVVGILLTVGAVMAVVGEKVTREYSPNLIPGNFTFGLVLGLMAGFCQALGAVLARKGMEECSALEATFIRLLISLGATLLMVAASGKVRVVAVRIWQSRHLKLLVPATTMGTWWGIWMSQVALKNSTVATSTTVMATCPLFAIPIVYIFFGYRTSVAAIAWTILAVVGIGLVVSNGAGTERVGGPEKVSTQAVSENVSGSPRNTLHWR